MKIIPIGALGVGMIATAYSMAQDSMGIRDAAERCFQNLEAAVLPPGRDRAFENLPITHLSDSHFVRIRELLIAHPSDVYTCSAIYMANNITTIALGIFGACAVTYAIGSLLNRFCRTFC